MTREVEVWTTDMVYRPYPIDIWTHNSGETGLTFTHRESRETVFFPWTNVVKVNFPAN